MSEKTGNTVASTAGAAESDAADFDAGGAVVTGGAAVGHPDVS